MSRRTNFPADAFWNAAKESRASVSLDDRVRTRPKVSVHTQEEAHAFTAARSRRRRDTHRESRLRFPGKYPRKRKPLLSPLESEGS